jgi:hypothetical protein
MPESPEAVALELFREVADAGSKRIRNIGTSYPAPDRKWIIETYAECLATVKGTQTRP